MANRSLYGHYVFAGLFLHVLNGHLYHLLSLSLPFSFFSFLLSLFMTSPPPGIFTQNYATIPQGLILPCRWPFCFSSRSMVSVKVPWHGQGVQSGKARYFMSKRYFIELELWSIIFMTSSSISHISPLVLSILKAGSSLSWENVECRADN